MAKKCGQEGDGQNAVEKQMAKKRIRFVQWHIFAHKNAEPTALRTLKERNGGGCASSLHFKRNLHVS
uniref:Uncharacterized protein n=1 Tax=Ascaris lumbricoides TaxID=6252 RepID=A0A0M3IRM8_ASCLU